MANIHTRAVMCKLSISQFNPKRKDAKTTAEVLHDKQASRIAGAWIQNLVNPDALLPIVSKAQQARIEFYKLTVPWADEGWRLLPITLYDKFHENMRELRTAFENEVTTFINEWDTHVKEAKQNLNGMFNAANYPSQDTLKYSFGFSIDVQPIPSGNDFRIKLQNDELEKIKQDTDERVKLAEQEAMKNVWSRLAEPIQKIVDKLKDEKSIFRNSLIENLREILDLIPLLNLAQDTNLNSFVAECKQKLGTANPNTLRDDKTARKTTLDNAEAILKKMEGYY